MFNCRVVRQALALLFVAAAGLSLAQTGFIQVRAQPGIQVFLDDVFVGVTNADVGGLILTDVDTGSRRLRFVQAGFLPQDATVSVVAGQVLLYEVGNLMPQVRVREEGEEGAAELQVQTGSVVVQCLPIECVVDIPALGITNRAKTQDRLVVDGVPVGVYDGRLSTGAMELLLSFEVCPADTVSVFGTFVGSDPGVRVTSAGSFEAGCGSALGGIGGTSDPEAASAEVRSESTGALLSLDGNLARLRSDGSLTVLRDTSTTLAHGKWDAGRTRLLVTERIPGVGSDHRVLEVDEAGVVVRDDRVLLVPPPAAGAWSRSFGWHPDGVSLLYREREMQDCDHTSIRRRHADGTETVFLDPAWVADVIVYSLDFHPSGREVLWTSQDGCWSPTLALFRADLFDGAVDVGSIEVLLDDGQHVDRARFSPNESLIAFMRSDASRGYGGPENLYVMNVDGSGLWALTNNRGSNERVGALAWSADARSLLFSMSMDNGSTYELYEVDVASAQFRQLTSASARALVLDW